MRGQRGVSYRRFGELLLMKGTTCAARRRQDLKAWQDARKKRPLTQGSGPRAAAPVRKSRESVLLGYSLSRCVRAMLLHLTAPYCRDQ